jgi:predicted Zn-dependent protease with MMP-like domain
MGHVQSRMTNSDFEALVDEALMDLPPYFASRLENVEVVIDRAATPHQRHRAGHQGGTLLGLYEGVPLTERGINYHLALPDRITLFQDAIESVCESPEEMRHEVRHTVVHEIAHFFGISDDRLRELGAY